MHLLDDYLTRIGIARVGGPEGLRVVQQAHMRALPFETIDPYLGTTPSLALPDIAQKLLRDGRGGYCFEHNTLLAEGLTRLGFAPEPLMARVYSPAGTTGARTHLALQVEADGRPWLCDAGFGGHGPLVPLALDTESAQEAPNGRYRLARADGVTTLLREREGLWIPLYALDSAPVHPVDIAAANHLCATWEGAPFRNTLMIAAHADRGRIALLDRRVSRGLPPATTESLLETEDSLAQVLQTEIGLRLSRETVAKLWARLSP